MILPVLASPAASVPAPLSCIGPTGWSCCDTGAAGIKPWASNCADCADLQNSGPCGPRDPTPCPPGTEGTWPWDCHPVPCPPPSLGATPPACAPPPECPQGTTGTSPNCVPDCPAPTAGQWPDCQPPPCPPGAIVGVWPCVTDDCPFGEEGKLPECQPCKEPSSHAGSEPYPGGFDLDQDECAVRGAIGVVRVTIFNDGNLFSCDALLRMELVKVDGLFAYAQVLEPGTGQDADRCSAIPPQLSIVFTSLVPAVPDPGCGAGVGDIVQLQPDQMELTEDEVTETATFTIRNVYEFCSGAQQEQQTVIKMAEGLVTVGLPVEFQQDVHNSDGNLWIHLDGTLVENVA